jgi:hypothetical protein
MVEPLMDKCPTEPVTLPHPVLRFVGQHKIQPLRWRHALEIQPSLADSDVRLGNRPRVAHNQPVLRFSHQLSDCINQHVNRLLVTMTCRHVPIARYARLKYRWIPEGVHLISVSKLTPFPTTVRTYQRVFREVKGSKAQVCARRPLLLCHRHPASALKGALALAQDRGTSAVLCANRLCCLRALSRSFYQACLPAQ